MIPTFVLVPGAGGTSFGWTPVVRTGAMRTNPRSYIRTAHDRVLPPPLQDLMIAEADVLTPANPFEVHTLHSSHLAPITQAARIADILADSATARRP